MADSENTVPKEIIEALGALMKKVEKRPRLVAALTDPQTSHEAFYSLLYGDVDTMLDKVRHVEQALNQAGETMTGRLNLQVSQLLTAADKSTRLINAVADAGKKQVITQLNDSKGEFSAEMMKTTRAAAIDAAIAGTREAIGSEVETTLGKVESAATAGALKFTTAAAKLETATKLYKTSALKLLGGALAVAIVAGVAMGATNHYMASAPVSSLTPDQVENIRNGQALKEAWPNLDVKAKTIINKSFKTGS